MSPHVQVGVSTSPPAIASAAEFLTVEEASALLRVSPKTVRAMIRRKEIPGRRWGKSYRINRDEFFRLLAT